MPAKDITLYQLADACIAAQQIYDNSWDKDLARHRITYEQAATQALLDAGLLPTIAATNLIGLMLRSLWNDATIWAKYAKEELK